MTLNNRGDIEHSEHYKNDILHGRLAKYKNNRPTEVMHYKDGLLDGLYISYFPYTDKPQREGQFKQGKQHGYLKYYDKDGKETIQFTYQNGKKIGQSSPTDQ